MLTKDLKSLATELVIPVIVMVQLNREAGKSEDAPKLEQLRDSGSIEQDANNVIFIHRKRDEVESSIVIAKQRKGRIGSLDMLFNSKRCAFEGDAKEFVAWMHKHGNIRDKNRSEMSENTVRRRTGIAKQIFTFAIECK